MKRFTALSIMLFALSLLGACGDDTSASQNGGTTLDTGAQDGVNGLDLSSDIETPFDVHTGDIEDEGSVTDTATSDDAAEDGSVGDDAVIPDSSFSDGTVGDDADSDTNISDTNISDTNISDTNISDDAANDTSVDTGSDDTSGDTVTTDSSDGGSDPCGDGVIDMPDETCDDGVRNDDTGNGTCREDCQPAMCNDGVVDHILNEQCDAADINGNALCDGACQLRTLCGGVNEQCDDGGANSDNKPNACRLTCHLPSCGDGVVDYGYSEECDDGNTNDGDGCDDGCELEASGSCQDGVLDLDQGEECDNGSDVANDGCSATCQLEPVVAGTCQDDGNATREDPEICDDGNAVNGDGCNPTCNLRGHVTTFLPGIRGGMAVDQDYLWISDSGTDTLYRIALGDVDDGMPATDDNCLTNYGPRCRTDIDVGVDIQETLATDGNTIWIKGNRVLHAVVASPPWTVTTVAGDPSAGPDFCGLVDGFGDEVRFQDLRGLTYYEGYVYMGDSCYGVLRRFDPLTNEVETIAGVPSTPTRPSAPTCPTMADNGRFSCNPGTPRDGFGAAAIIDSPRYITSDNSGNLFFIDTQHVTVRSYNILTGWVGTVAGDPGNLGYTDAVGQNAQMERPRGLTSDGHSLYWAEQREYTVRQLDVVTQEVTTLAGQRGCSGTSTDKTGGTGTVMTCDPATYPNFNTPLNIVFHYPSNSLFVSDNAGIRRIE